MVKKKRKSKRTTLKQKYKVIKKVTQHHRKLRKQEKSHGGKKPKNPGIPNNWPFKEELMNQLEQARLQEQLNKEELKQKRKEEKKEKLRHQMDALSTLPENLVATKDVTDSIRDSLQAAIEKADVVLIVLDARDPQGCRPLTFEDGLIGKKKVKVAYVLNKVDLIDPNVAGRWLNYLRRYHPTIAVKSLSKSAPSPNCLSGILYHRTQNEDTLRDNGHVDALRELLDQIGSASAASGEEKALNVAITGYPNVGKSALFNSLLKSQVSSVESKAGTTKTLVERSYNPYISLMDCPALDLDYSGEWSSLMRHCVARSFAVDPVPQVKDLLERCHTIEAMRVFSLPMFKSHEDFLVRYATRHSMKRKGGDLNIVRAARSVFDAIHLDRVRLSCSPPKPRGEAFDLPSWYNELNVDAMQRNETQLFSSITALHHGKVLHVSSPNVTNLDGSTIEYDIAVGDMTAYLDVDENTDEEEEEEDVDDQEEDIEDESDADSHDSANQMS